MQEISNIPKPARIKMRAASTLRVSATLLKKNGQPMDLTGSSFDGKIGTATSFSVTMVDALLGKFEFEISPTDVPVVLEPTWKIDLIDSNLRVIPLVAGPFKPRRAMKRSSGFTGTPSGLPVARSSSRALKWATT